MQRKKSGRVKRIYQFIRLYIRHNPQTITRIILVVCMLLISILLASDCAILNANGYSEPGEITYVCEAATKSVPEAITEETTQTTEVTTVTKTTEVTTEETTKAVTYSVSDITIPSNMNSDQINTMLKGTWLEGFGDVYYNMEQKYGINVIYAVSVAHQEVGWRDRESRKAVMYCNIYGIVGNRNYYSYANCIDYFGDFQRRLYVNNGLVNVYDIETYYCPPNDNGNDGTWGKCVEWFMHYFYHQYQKNSI